MCCLCVRRLMNQVAARLEPSLEQTPSTPAHSSCSSMFHVYLRTRKAAGG